MANRSIKSERINAMTGWPIGKVGFLRNILKFAVFLALLAPLAGHASNAEYLKIYLMQPKEIILQKINGVDGLDRYIKEVETTINQKIAKSVLAQSWGFLVIAVRHDGKIKAWVDTDEEISPEITSAMIAVATHNKGFEVKEGVVIFALGFALDGAALPENKMPFPNDWKKVAKCVNEECKETNAEEIVLKSW